MVLESIFNPFKAEKKPWDMFLIGYLYSFLAVFISIWIFRSEASLIMVFLTVIACVPIIYNTMKLEESKDLVIKSDKELLLQHNKAILFFMFLFFGITLSFTTWYIFFDFILTALSKIAFIVTLGIVNLGGPDITVSDVFKTQTNTIQAINNQVSGNFFEQMPLLSKILLNNINVLAFSILFALLYGAGAIFILTWNASVIAAAMGNFIQSRFAEIAGTVGFAKVAGYVGVASLGLLRYSIHGIPEILAYFYGGLAGGILSVAIIKKHYKDKKFTRILFDVSELLIIAVSFLVVAAFLEVYVTPLFF